MAQCRITEIFYSLQGESRTVGQPTVFVRLTGCPLRCNYCDTDYAFHGGEKLEIVDIVDQVAAYQPRYITVTGGEPLAQSSCYTLLTALCDRFEDAEISLETSGAMDIAKVDPRVVCVMDLKTPASGEMKKNKLQNIALLKPQDQVKFVISDQADYDWSKDMLKTHDLSNKAEILCSPIHGELPPEQLADWILADRLPVRMQVQLHKYLWDAEQGR